ncbi:MAG: DUF349 domain-containing protein [Bacteroidetes bacterium]|uniref:DUF349 domain-containing protein n=1 Tax=Candidatus Cryptobacteroides faecigallinarum TaxID=2840763 RepID=A0A9D9NIV3_9BACT|nr:DUF349 domain-containing protein [Candidatus Cryptobacteroides faecigallinarum]
MNSKTMSDEIIRDVADVPEVTEETALMENAPEESAAAVNYSEKTLSELVALFEELGKNEDRMKLNKEAEAIKTAFYKRLTKEKAEAGDAVSEDAFTEIENGFKAYYNTYKKERAEYNARQEKEREENLVKKEAVIADLKALLEKQEDVNATFPAFREIQDRWRAIGPVPVQNYRNINDTYQLYVEQFYDMVKINRELRDLDFKKNLEAKEKFCEMAEKLAGNENIVEAFKELQKLHEQWKEYGPVAKQFREEIWDRFKAATAVINKKYQAYFEGLKEQQTENLAAKTALCEKVEEIAGREIKNSADWNALSKEIEEIQKQWRTIGFATRKENQKIYDRFRAACDKFYGRKREFYTEYKDSMNANLEKKISLCEAAEALKTSTEWKKATDQFINLQKQWKEIGAVPRKKSEQLWKRFRAACDEFFNERDKNAKPENNFYGNLKAKQKLVAEIDAYQLTGDEAKDHEALEAFMQRWQEIGFVPFKEKDNIAQAYKEAVNRKFPDASKVRKSHYAKAPKSEKERLIQKYSQLEQDIVTYENNIGFFAMSKNSEPLIRQMQERIEQSKKELKVLENKIRSIDEEE